MEGQTPQPKTEKPAEIVAAETALRTLADHGDIEQLRRVLPSVAVKLARAGEEVTPEILLDQAAQGLDHLKSLIAKNYTLSYDNVLERWDKPREHSAREHRAERIAGSIDAAFYYACSDGDFDKARALLKQGADPWREMHMLTSDIAENNRVDILSFMISAKLKIDEHTYSRLFDSCMRQQSIDAARLLVDKKLVDVSYRDSYFLEDYVKYARSASIVYTGELGQMTNKFYMQKLLPDAVWRGCNAQAVKALLDAGAAPDGAMLSKMIESFRPSKDIMVDTPSDIGALKAVFDACTPELVRDSSADLTAQLVRSRHMENEGVEVSRLVINTFAPYLDASQLQSRMDRAIQNGCAPQTLQVLIDHGATPSPDIIPRTALDDSSLSLIRFIEEDCSVKLNLAAQDRAEYEGYCAKIEAWKSRTGAEPPQGLTLEDPARYHAQTFKAVQAMLAREGYAGTEANRMAYNASALFVHEQPLLQYMLRWGKNGQQPLHDLVQNIRMPKQGNPDLAAWTSAIRQCGPEMVKLFSGFASKLPKPGRSRDEEKWSLNETRYQASRFRYRRSTENMPLAAMCFRHGVAEETFNKALDLIPQAPAKKNIPEITIDGERFGMPGAVFRRLAADDPVGLFLGNETDCCQKVDGHGHDCAVHGYTAEDGGFYVIEKDNKIQAQTWAWRGDGGEMVLDTLETLGRNVTAEQWQKALECAAGELAVRKDHDVTTLSIGMGGGTPLEFGTIFKEAEHAAIPRDGYSGYRESEKQVVIGHKLALGSGL